MTGQKETVGFLESCRLCLRNQGMYNIFTIDILMQDIKEFTGVTMLFSINLPQMICTKCSDILKNMKHLREIAAKNNMSMKYLVNCGRREVPEPDHNKQIFVDETSSSVDCCIDVTDEFGESYTIKVEDVTVDENPHGLDFINKNSYIDKNTSPSTHKVTVRSDLFFQPEIKPASDTQDIKPELHKLTGTKKPKLEMDTNLRCQICGKLFASCKKLYCHMRSHNRPFSCTSEGCEKKFASKEDLARHSRIHTGVKPYECDLCSRKFTQNGTLKAHKEAVHKIVMPSNYKRFHAS